MRDENSGMEVSGKVGIGDFGCNDYASSLRRIHLGIKGL